MAQTDPDLVVANARKKFPDYAPMSDDAIKKDLASKHPGAYGYLTRPKWEEPKTTTEGPDIVGRTKAALVKEPPAGSTTAVSRALFGERIGSWDTPGRVVRAAGDLFLPGSVPEAAGLAATLPITGGLLTAPLKRTAASAFAGGLARIAQTGDVMQGLMTAASQGLSQLAGEMLPGALRFGLTQRAGGKALAGRAAEIATRDKKVAHDVAMDKAVGDLEKEGYTRDVATRRAAEAGRVREARATHQEQAGAIKRAHAEAVATQKAEHEAAITAATERHATETKAYADQGARTIAESFKQQVPAFRDFPSNEQGLLHMVSGEGPQRMSEAFDVGMQDIVLLGRGHGVNIPMRDAQALGLPTNQIVQQADKALPDLVKVDGAQLAQAATGFWKKDHGVYRRVVSALDKADLGDPGLRGEYRAGRALLEFAEDSQMLKGQKFNPEAARAAFDKVKKLDALRKRGQGDMFTGPIAEAVNRPRPALTLPAAPAPLAEPVLPAFRRPAPLPEVPKPGRRVIQPPPELSPTPEGVTVKNLPKMSWFEGAMIGEIPFLVGQLATGHMHPAGYGAGVAGAIAARSLSQRPIVRTAPLSAAERFATSTAVPAMAAQEARRLLGPP